MTQEEIIAEDDRLITVDVARAVDERELIAYYQPVVNIATRAVVSAEALVRWTMPDSTVVPAALFVPSLERTNTICGLDWYMIEEICTFLEGATESPAHVPVAINLSPRHADDSDFVKKFAASTEWHAVTHDFVRLEFRQADLIGNDALTTLASNAMKEGFMVSVDNFAGTIDELLALDKLGIRIVKVARSLWFDAAPEALAELVGCAKQAGITLSAEGVEEEGDLDRLTAAGIEFGQGYFFAKPADDASFKEFCAQ